MDKKTELNLMIFMGPWQQAVRNIAFCFIGNHIFNAIFLSIPFGSFRGILVSLIGTGLLVALAYREKKTWRRKNAPFSK